MNYGFNTRSTLFSAMEAKEFKDFGKEMIDYVATYLENIRDR